VLHAFTGSLDGALPAAGVIRDKKGNLFGTTSAGGRNLRRGRGTVFEIAPDGTETLLHHFNSRTGGAEPSGGLFSRGHYLYGTTVEGGGSDAGTVFRLRH
jgi:uncharacterized repeat protein (TIGR03803 family)